MRDRKRDRGAWRIICGIGRGIGGLEHNKRDVKRDRGAWSII